MSAGVAYVVLPGDIDDPGAPSGGNHYDRQVVTGLTRLGWRVRELAVPGSWPRPAEAERTALAAALAGVPDGAVVLLDGLVACGVPEVVGPAAGRLRVAVLVHLPLGDETGLPPEVAARLDDRERQTLRAAPVTVATSAGTGRRLVERHGLPAARVHVVPPGVAAAPLAPGTDGAASLLCVASVIPRKGHDVLVEALATIPDRPWTCRCVGPVDRDPGHLDRLRHTVEAAGLADRVRFVGPRTGSGLAAEYAAADLLVLPSRAEPYGMVVTEALARGVPVLGSAVDGLPEAVGRTPDGVVPGLLVPPGDPTALAGALRRWFAEPGLRHRLRAAARDRRADLPGWDVTAARLGEVLTALAGQPGPARQPPPAGDGLTTLAGQPPPAGDDPWEGPQK
ncbi:glycosyltransferase family 4 protein [Plantactinospora mayteni]|uniref:glycosyltransferase family 4 protein n=1 Tax=Plantactinospora mayteni TaxID=566021 RepID=UPI001943B9E6|nr:glycosyltransferase family 4 protein [Plantactinospora mayteni]